MFDLFPNFWTPILPAIEIADKPVAVQLAGERLVLFRNATGEIGTLVDRCPHRGAALSLGRVDANGCLECPYHGWQFDRDGNCQHVPLNDPTKLASQLSTVALPTQIVAGLVWVFTGQGQPPELQLPASLRRSAESYFIYHELWNAHWTRLMENAMDYSHLPFVHRNSFGGAIGQPAIAAGSFVEVEIDKTAGGMRVFNRYHNIDSGFAFEWYQPNLVVLKFDEMGMPVRVHSFAIPIDRQRTRYLIAIELLAPDASAIVKEFIDPIVEDRVIIESQSGAIPPIDAEYHVPADRATLGFRHWYHQTIGDVASINVQK
jgi:phenylpropionate dioxygenase-like ring-hydroxylating dioxygenase large terminal subunit